MDREELKTYLAAQVEEIQKFKWIESEQFRQDIGFQAAAMMWIDRYSEGFRRFWQESHTASEKAGVGL